MIGCSRLNKLPEAEDHIYLVPWLNNLAEPTSRPELTKPVENKYNYRPTTPAEAKLEM